MKAALAILAGVVALAWIGWWSMSESWMVRLALLFFVGFILACLAVTPGGLAWLLSEDRPATWGAEPVKVLTLHQPYAQLIALGVKSIETRSWAAPASLIGQRFAVHAAARKPCHGEMVGEYEVSLYGEHGPELGRRVDGRWTATPLPLGCIVATAVLDDCVPMIEHGEEHPEGHSLLLSPPEFGMRLCRLSRANGGSSARLVNVEAQRPYGDFRGGRWAWLLRDVEPVTEKCPACRGSAVGKRVVRRCPGPARPEDFMPCQVCRRTPGRCDPIPFKGGQGLSREWTP